MYKFSKSVLINRSQKDVFDFLRNPANITRWQSGVEAAEWTSTGAPGVGSTYKSLVKIPGSKSEAIFEVTHWDPPYRYGYKSIKLSMPVNIQSSYTLTSAVQGTQLTFEAQIEAAGILKIAEGLLGKMAEKGDGSSIETLKQLLEAG